MTNPYSSPADNRVTSISYQRRRFLAATAVGATTSVAGCMDLIRDQIDQFQSLTDSYAKLTPDGDLKIALQFGGSTPEDSIEEVVEIGAGHDIQHLENGSVDWYDNYVLEENSDTYNQLSGQLSDFRQFAQESSPPPIQSSDAVLIGVIRNVIDPINPETFEPHRISLPPVHYTGNVSNTYVANPIQLPDGQIHTYPAREFNEESVDFTDDITASLNSDPPRLTFINEASANEEYDLSQYPLEGTTRSERETLVPRYETTLHPELAMIASLWDTLSFILNTAANQFGDREASEQQLRTDAQEFARLGTAAGFSPISYPNPDEDSPYTSYNPIDSTLGITIQQGTETASGALNMVSLLSSFDDMNNSVNSFADQADKLVGTWNEFENALESSVPVDWEGIAEICSFCSTVVIPHMATANTPNSIRLGQELLHRLLGGDAYSDISTFQELMQFVERNDHRLVGNASVLWTEIRSVLNSVTNNADVIGLEENTKEELISSL